MTKDAKNIAQAFDLISLACEQIKDKDRCENCPRHHMCVEDSDNSLIDYADLVSASSWQEFLDFVDKCLPSETRQQQIDDSRLYDEWKEREF